ncbi:MAG: TonB family protein [Deltaproteobacteria bacterium]|nr:TonB family protein [Deltaproteobacteria bacterium]
MVLLLLLLLVGGAVVAYLVTREPPAPPPPPPDDPAVVTNNSLVTAPPPPLPELPAPLPEEPDAGEPTKTVRKTGGRACNGTVDTAAVRRYAQSNSGALRRCYERRLKMNNLLQGRMEIGLTIGPGGQVQGARINADSVRDPEVAQCVRQAVSGWRLPAPAGGCVNVTYPISFTPASGR